jgi:hypothetical protein
MMAQSIQLAKRPHVIVGTPGRVVDHLTNTKVGGFASPSNSVVFPSSVCFLTRAARNAQGFSLRTLKALVLDEADRLLNLDFEQEIDQILKVIPTEDRRTMLFSATMTSKVAKLQRACLNNPVKVREHATALLCAPSLQRAPSTVSDSPSLLTGRSVVQILHSGYAATGVHVCTGQVQGLLHDFHAQRACGKHVHGRAHLSCLTHWVLHPLCDPWC